MIIFSIYDLHGRFSLIDFRQLMYFIIDLAISGHRDRLGVMLSNDFNAQLDDRLLGEMLCERFFICYLIYMTI